MAIPISPLRKGKTPFLAPPPVKGTQQSAGFRSLVTPTAASTRVLARERLCSTLGTKIGHRRCSALAEHRLAASRRPMERLPYLTTQKAITTLPREIRRSFSTRPATAIRPSGLRLPNNTSGGGNIALGADAGVTVIRRITLSVLVSPVRT